MPKTLDKRGEIGYNECVVWETISYMDLLSEAVVVAASERTTGSRVTAYSL